MNKQYDCNIILDLLPLSIENMVTEETQEVIDQHLLTCESCRQIYEDMTRELDITSVKKKRKKKKRHKYKRKSLIKKCILGYLLFLALIMAFCVIDICFFC